MPGGNDDDARPLDGVRVVELCQWVAGPAAAGILADWGADVIKVEAPGGDPQRRVFASVGIEKELPNPPFAQDNRGKRSVVLDLADPGDRDRFERLLDRADVLVTNLRPDALHRLDLDPAAVSRRHQSLVIGALSGYGPVGPARDVPGYDIGAFWSRSGLARTNNPADQPPLNVRSGVGDHITGMATAMGVLAALFERSRTGRGRVVETSLFSTGLYAGSWDLSIQGSLGRLATLRPRERAHTPLVNSYQAGDGRWFYLIGLEAERHFPGLVRALERPDLLDDERFATAGSMARNAEVLVAVLDDAFAERDLDEWAARFDEHDVWWAPCQSMAEVLDDPQAHAVGAFVPTSDGTRELGTVASPARFDGQVFQPRRPVPTVGQHTAEVLAELGDTDPGATTRS
jgi:crotonobetainyl-CoA:carnitine CoA-transferase CaiB-like acyl-CoA transferase